ncbi:hypothetical protein IEQ34_022079 [Dendrobium chrysotoxum]|uniref:Uncharacterized protein n=1 Tax=Dendrobium chrysotoxum TaxID=161865 RepID=A0AAV7FXX9_DENCH|nr:hypothetical protein IEQ34_022079 [Dendrobium chrysotoxum]
MTSTPQPLPQPPPSPPSAPAQNQTNAVQNPHQTTRSVASRRRGQRSRNEGTRDPAPPRARSGAASASLARARLGAMLPGAVSQGYRSACNRRSTVGRPAAARRSNHGARSGSCALLSQAIPLPYGKSLPPPPPPRRQRLTAAGGSIAPCRLEDKPVTPAAQHVLLVKLPSRLQCLSVRDLVLEHDQLWPTVLAGAAGARPAPSAWATLLRPVTPLKKPLPPSDYKADAAAIESCEDDDRQCCGKGDEEDRSRPPLFSAAVIGQRLTAKGRVSVEQRGILESTARLEGIAPLKLFEERSSLCSLDKFDRVSGMLPERLFLSSRRVDSDEHCEISVGIPPERKFSLRSSSSKLESRERSAGMLPERWFSWSWMVVRLEQLPSSAGIWPERLFLEMERTCRDCR